ncbi:MAG TPA: nucleoside recognition domain-containing protein [bacterium]|nr:nucleoside recognition domain-containing protein [bacterium]
MKEKPSPINTIWLMMVLISVVAASYTGNMSGLTASVFESAKSAVTLAIGLVGAMALWLGIMKVMEEAGALKLIAKAVRPVMTRLFPDVPHDHPAMSAMVMNIAANMLGLGNAATPMGIKAMTELDKLNKEKGTATNAMCLFLAINTSSVTLLPLGVITVRASAGASEPASILIPSILATILSTSSAIIASKLLQSKSSDTLISDEKDLENKAVTDYAKPGRSALIVVAVFIALIAGGIYFSASSNTETVSWRSFMQALSDWLIPVIMVAFLLFGYLKGVKLYETVTEGAKEGFNVAVKIIPFMVAIFVAVGMFRSSGALDIMVNVFNPLTSLIGMPAEALPMALIRPLSGSGAFGIMSEIISKEPDSFLSYLVSTMQGSTETTFYVLAIYFGAVGIKNARHAVPAALIADGTGIIGSVIICRMLF